MVSNISDFPEFNRAIREDSLVYLFGTGISAALTGERYSWYKWINEGLEHMSDSILSDQYRNALDSDPSVDTMIDCAGKIIAAVKADGTYDSWMKESFESNALTNDILAETLKKMLRLQDVFATTNYDLLLERATGLATQTYENSDVAFKMLDKKTSTHVLHIHGAYDSLTGLDNIVAGREQYEAVLSDEGAQFIQHILGTRTLIFVGCGQTTEDPNIAKFIQFAKMYLKLDREYYFLCKSGQSFDGMPVNIKLIPYGSDYDDLQPFLDNLAQERLIAFAEKYTFVGRTAYLKRNAAADSLLQYHYSQESIPFCGRQDEIRQLNEFLETTDPCSWWCITGQAGAGKSRLALELLKVIPTCWYGFFLNDHATPGDVDVFLPFADTVVIIDYISGRERFAADIMGRLYNVFSSSGYRLRILLIERENRRSTGSWYTKLVQRFGKYSVLTGCEYKMSFLNLKELDDEAVADFIGAVCANKNLEIDRQRDELLREAYRKKFEVLRFRPLFVQIFVEAWIEQNCSLPRYDDFEDLLKLVLDREQEKWLILLDDNQVCCNAFVRLLVRANITGWLDLDDLPHLYEDDGRVVSEFVSNHSFPGRQQKEAAESLLQAFCQNDSMSNTRLTPLFPDIIKEYMFYYYSDEKKLSGVINELWTNAANEFSVFLTRCITDFPENRFFTDVLHIYEEDISALAGRLELLKKTVINENDDPGILLSIIDHEYDFWKELRIPTTNPDLAEEIAMLKVAGLDLVATRYAGWSIYDMSLMMEAVEAELSVPGGDVLTEMKKIFLQEHVNQLSMAGFTDESESLRAMMDQLLIADSDSPVNSYYLMVNKNDEMMNAIFDCNFDKAYGVLIWMQEHCDYQDKYAVGMLAHSCANIDELVWHCLERKYRGVGLAIVDKILKKCPNNDEVKIRNLQCKTSELSWLYIVDSSIDERELIEQLDEIDLLLEGFPLKDKDLLEAYDQVWAASRVLRLNVIGENIEELEKIIDGAKSLLAQFPQMSGVLTACIMSVHEMHKQVLKDKIPYDDVEYLFRYVEINSSSMPVRDAFFKMLEDSTEAKNRDRYLTKNVIQKARQDSWYNPMGSGLKEFDEEPEFEDFLNEYQPSEPYRRMKPKIGRNDPCPCGSGKKFKKCCLGNGRFD